MFNSTVKAIWLKNKVGIDLNESDISYYINSGIFKGDRHGVVLFIDESGFLLLWSLGIRCEAKKWFIY